MNDIAPNPQSYPTLAPNPGMPPHPLDTQWYLHVSGQTYGPYTGHQLKQFAAEGRVDGASQVMSVGSDAWTRLGEETRLAGVLKAQIPSPPPLTAGAGATVVQVTNHVAAPTMLLDDGSLFGPKSAGVALLLSFLLCGAGQMYCGRAGKGFLMLFGCVFLWFILLGWIIQIWSMIDAYNTAKQMNLRYLQRLQSMRA